MKFLANSEPAFKFSSHIWTFSSTWMILLMTAWLTRSSSLEIFLKSIIFNSIVLMIDEWINDWMIDWMKQKSPLYGGFKCLPRALAAEVGAQLVVHLNSRCQHILGSVVFKESRCRCRWDLFKVSQCLVNCPSTGWLFNCSAQISVLKRKTLFNQWGSFVHREFHGTESLINCPLFFILVLKIGRNS